MTHYRPSGGTPGSTTWARQFLTAAVTCLELLTTWGAGVRLGLAHNLSLGGGPLVLLGLLTEVERKVAEPVVPIHLLSNRFKVATSVSLIIGVAMFGAISFLPLFLHRVKGARRQTPDCCFSR